LQLLTLRLFITRSSACRTPLPAWIFPAPWRLCFPFHLMLKLAFKLSMLAAWLALVPSLPLSAITVTVGNGDEWCKAIST
jgi:hypothetical protein